MSLVRLVNNFEMPLCSEVCDTVYVDCILPTNYDCQICLEVMYCLTMANNTVPLFVYYTIKIEGSFTGEIEQFS